MGSAAEPAASRSGRDPVEGRGRGVGPAGCGLFVAVLGPDGSGKSSLIAALCGRLAGDFTGVEVFHLRPRLVRSRPATGSWLPYARPPYGRAKSVVKLGAMGVDYAVGYRTRVRPLLRAGRLVLFDRYFDDILVDPLRYRYRGPLTPARWLASALPHPDLFLILDAPAETLRMRKQELPLPELRRQRAAYRRLADRRPRSRSLVLDVSGGLDGVVERAIAAIRARRRPPEPA